MKTASKEIQLKSGISCLLKSPGPEDAAGILTLMKVTSDETLNMGRYSDEITMTPAEEAMFLQNLGSSPWDAMVCAVIDGEIVANGGINRIRAVERYRHRAELGISIKQAYWGLGIGTAIMEELLRLSRAMGFEQVELDVVSTNSRAFALYEKAGFQIYGKLEHAFRYRDGSYAALYQMVCYL